MSRTFVWGKFSPFHLGHELLLTVASHFGDEGMFVFVSERAPWFGWTSRVAAASSFTASIYATSHFLMDTFRDPPSVDANGTCTDETWWVEWKDYVLNELRFRSLEVRPDDYVVSSDLYGAEIARRLGCRWIPVDPPRELVNLSGTVIRDDPWSNWDRVSQHMKVFATTRIAFMGPESVGKTTMVDKLGMALYIPRVPEYGRTLYEVHPDGKDLKAEWRWESILATQQQMIKFTARHSPAPAILIDTEAIVTKIFWKRFSSESYDEWKCDIFARMNDIDHYVLLAPTVPFVDDGTRLTEKMDRNEIFEEMIEEVKETGKPYTVIDSPDYKVREAQAVIAINGAIDDNIRSHRR